MKIKYQRNHSLSLEQNVIDIQQNVPTTLVYVGHDNNYIHFLDSEVEKQQERIFQEINDG